MARTLDGMYTTRGSLWSRLMRNVRLLLRIGTQMFDYFVTGARIRREYRRRKARGEVYWLD